MRAKAVLRTIGFVALVAFAVWIVVSATAYNAQFDSTCEEAGMTWVKEYPFGDYGCAHVTPMDEMP